MIGLTVLTARRIDQGDMHYRDQHVLKRLRETMNPETRYARITLVALAAEMNCHINTMTRITDRLEDGGHILKHNSGKRGRGLVIEVLPCSDQPCN